MQSFMSSACGRASIALAAFFVVGAASANAATFSYDFNSPQADFTEKFNATGGNTVTTGGLSGTQALGRTTGGGTYIYYRTPLAQFTTAGETASISYYFLGSVNNAIGTNDFLGFSTNLTNGNPTSFSTTNLVAGVKAQLINNALVNSAYSNTSLRLETSNTSGSGLNATADSDTFVLVPASTSPAEWFYQTLSLTYNGNNSFDITTTLSRSSTDGTVGTPLDSYTVTREGLTSLVNVPLYGGFQVHSSGGSPIRANLADNFSATAVPEPTSLAVLGMAGLIGLRRRRAV